MKVTLEEYIKNPMGKGHSLMTNRSMYDAMYTQKFNALIAREAGTFKVAFFRNKDKQFWIHFYIPSDTPKLFYDVVFEFTAPDLTIEGQTTLNNYHVKFYSNDPAFTFTHAHAFNVNDLLIQELKSKQSSKALKEKSEFRNPKDEIGYVKTIYLAYLYYKLKNFNQKSTWNEVSIVSKSRIISSIKHATAKLEEATELKKEHSAAKRMGKRTESRAIKQPITKTKSVSKTPTTKRSGRVKTVKKI